MAIIPDAQYPGKVAPGTPQYPLGSAQNITAPGDGTGTPWEQALVNDIFGFQQSLLDEAGITASGNPDQVGASDYLDALKVIINNQATSTPDRNLFHNSNFQITHRGNAIVVGAANVYNTYDRWQVGGNGANSDGNYSVSLLTNSSIGGVDIISDHLIAVGLQEGATPAEFFLGQRFYDPWQLSGKTISMSFWIENKDGVSTDYNNLVSGAIPVGITGITSTIKSAVYQVQFGAGRTLITTTLTFPTFSGSDIVNPRSCFIVCPVLWNSALDPFQNVDFEIGDIWASEGATVPAYRSNTHSDEEMVAVQYFEEGGDAGEHGFSGSASSGFVYYARTVFASGKRFTPVSLVLTDRGAALGFPSTVGSVILDQRGFRETRVSNTSNNQARWESAWVVDCEQLDGM